MKNMWLVNQHLHYFSERLQKRAMCGLWTNLHKNNASMVLINTIVVIYVIITDNLVIQHMSFAGLLLKSHVSSIIRVLNKTNCGRSDVFYIMHSSLQRPDTPRCCLGQLSLKSASFGLMPEICRQRLHVSGRPLKEIEKKRLAFPRNAQKLHKLHTHTRIISVTLVSLFCPRSLSVDCR